MKKILHLSDLHFGTERPGLVELLIEQIREIKPDIVIISGDLTQRARILQFKSARKFIQSLSNVRVLCVPGNHDISLYNLIERYLYPYYKYKKFITPKLTATYNDNEVAIFGINSVTPYKPMGGYVTESQLDNVTQFFSTISDSVIKIVVMHHNLIYSERHKIINDAEKIISTFSESNVNLILAGHIHEPLIEQLEREYLKHKMYVITAGTAISHRTIAPNSFNLIEVSQSNFILSVHEYKNGKFIASDQQVFPF